MEYRTLSNGLSIQAIGFGTYKIPDASAGVSIVEEAIEAGYRLIDTAAMYGNEELVGKAIRTGIDKGLTTRNQLIITTKLANADRGYDPTLQAFERSRKALGIEQIDLYLVHWPASQGITSDWRKINASTWKAFEHLYKEGSVKAIGVSNFMPIHLDALAYNAEFLPMVNQIEFHPGLKQCATLRWCAGNDVLIEGWSPLGRTRLFENALLKSIAQKYECTVPQICLRWAYQHGVVPIPKTTSRERMVQNLDIFNFVISPDDMEAIDTMPPTGESGLTPDTITF